MTKCFWKKYLGKTLPWTATWTSEFLSILNFIVTFWDNKQGIYYAKEKV